MRASPEPAGPKVALLGCGYWGKNLCRNFYELGALQMIVETDREARERVAERWPDVRLATSAREAFEDPSVDGVVIATPAPTHAGLALEAIAAGKDVFVEKPLALTVREGARVVEAAERASRIVMVGHLLEYHPAVVELERRVLGGELGALRYVYSNRLNWGRLRREENILWSFAPHDVAVLLRLVGDVPTRVAATGSAWLRPDVHDVTVTHLEFPGGVSAHIFVSWLHPHKEQRLVVTGDSAVAVFEDSAAERERKLRMYSHSVQWRDRAPVAHKAPEETIAYEDREPLRAECEAFLDAIATRNPPPTDGPSALRVLRVLEAAQRSLEKGGEWVDCGASAPAPDTHESATVHPTAVVDPGARIGAGTKVWHFSHVSSGAEIGHDCVLGQNAFIAPNVRIGRGVRLQNNVSVYTGVTLEDDVFVGPSAVFTNVLTPRSHVSRKDEYADTVVERRATIGANATVVCGSRIGHHAFVAAGAVVTRDVAPHSLVRGVPARHTGWACACGEVLPVGAAAEVLECERCGRRWSERDGTLEPAPQ